MEIYSHSRLSTFEQCPLKFKYKYKDKIPELKKTIEAHLGRIVHKTLEWFYIELKKGKIPTIEELIVYYTQKWEEKYEPSITITKKEVTINDYFNKGVQYLLKYYMKHKPFDDNTLEVEKKIIINLDENGKYKIQGFIDRLAYNRETKEFEVHDYKTANTPPAIEKIENDRQLALYSIAIKNLFGSDKKICLVWHYLAHDIRICSRRTNEQLEQLKKETIELIQKIESTTKFPAYISRLCDWCEYKSICQAWVEKAPTVQKKLTLTDEKVEELDIWS